MAVTVVTGSGPFGGGTAVTNPLDTRAATLLVVSVSAFAGAGSTTGTVSDNKGNTWTALTLRDAGDASHRFFYCNPTTVSSGHIVTVTSPVQYAVVSFYACTGHGALQVEAGAVTTVAGPLATGSVTPSVNGALIFSGWAGGNATSNPTVGSGLTAISQNPVNNFCVAGATGYLVQTTAAAINPTWTWTGTDHVAAAVAVFLPFVPPAGLSRRQSTGKVIGSGTTLALSFADPPLLGSAIVVPVIAFNSDLTGGICTDNQGNTYTRDVTRFVNGSNTCAIFSCAAVAVTGSPFTLTVTKTGVQNFLGSAIEVRGVVSGLLLDRSASNNGSSTTPSTGTTGALVGPDVFEVAVHTINGTQASITVDAAVPVWVEDWEHLSNVDQPGEADSRLVTGAAGATHAASWTAATSGAWTACLAAYRDGPAAGGETAQPYVWGPM